MAERETQLLPILGHVFHYTAADLRELTFEQWDVMCSAAEQWAEERAKQSN